MHVFLLHGYGGQGVDTSRRILGRAAFLSGLYVQDFTLHPMEWRSQPTLAYVKTSKTPIISHDTPLADFILIFDAALASSALQYAKDSAVALFNSNNRKLPIKKVKSYYLPATGIALANKISFPNTAMLGAFCKVFARLSLRDIKRAMEAEIKEMQSENVASLEEGYRTVKKR
jgi:2-oxoacid:acceptor oxidoreductase gamma subunit (pyruvate/2-ketoisovalerate family)